MNYINSVNLDPNREKNQEQVHASTPSTETAGQIQIQGIGSFTDVAHLFYKMGIFDNLVHDAITEEDIMIQLKDHKGLFQISYGNEFGGMFMVDDLGIVAEKKTVEIHAFIIPYMRKHSRDFLNVFAEFIFTHSNFEVIMTTVPEHCYKVGRLLGFMGFKEIGFLPDQYKRDNELLGLTYYILTKNGE